MMKKLIIRILKSFCFGMAISEVVLLLIQAVSYAVGHPICPMTPEYISYFPSESIAMQVDILLYGLFGIAFSGWSFIYEIDRIGFVLQNIIYAVGTMLIWVPVVCFVWQLWRYPQPLWCTIGGFVLTYAIMTVTVYRTTKREVEEVNRYYE